MKNIQDFENKLLCGDNVEILSEMPDNSVDLILTSPPYDNLRTYNGYGFDLARLSPQLYRILKDGGAMVWIVADATVGEDETGTSFRQALHFKEMGFRLFDTMIYEKKGSSLPHKRYFQTFEYMFVFSKGKLKTRNLIADHKNKWAGVTQFGAPTVREANGEVTLRKKRVVKEYSLRTNVWEYNAGYGFGHVDKHLAHKHPATFPMALAKDHIISWTNEGDFVLDPFNGSGTTTKMAFLLNRRYCGMDISSEYVKLAEERLEYAKTNGI